MNMILEKLKEKLDPTLLQNLAEISTKSALSTETILERILKGSSYSLTSLQRMSTERLEMVLASPAFMDELKRLLWKAHWVNQAA